MVSFYISRADKVLVEKIAAGKGQTKADTYRELLALGLVYKEAGKPGVATSSHFPATPN